MTLGVSEQGLDTALDGVLIIHKPAGWTSHDVVAKVRRLLGIRKVGHTGTLDPLATGVLVLCLGKATRIAEYLFLADKAYRAVLRLGSSTDTQDATGSVVTSHPGPYPDDETIRSVMEACVGINHQLPPMYSAVKVKGEPLYKAAREGRTIPRVSRECTVHDLQIVSFLRTSTVDVVFDVVCSKGTYVRTLCADFGETLGVGGHLASLERRRVGRFELAQALTLEDLAQIVEGKDVARHVHTLTEALAELPAFLLDDTSSESARHGTGFSASRVLRTEGHWRRDAPIRLHSADGRLMAIGTASSGSEDRTNGDPVATVRIEKVLV